MPAIKPVILCGGGGTRLWSKSRQSFPKPFHKLIGDESLFESTLARIGGEKFLSPIVVSGDSHVELLSEQLGRDGLAQLIIEPAAKNTAPAIALAASRLEPETIMLVCPSDHHIEDALAFGEAVEVGARLAASGWLVTLGITPTGPETGFGYIERGDDLGSGA